MEPFGLTANCLALLLATLLSTKGLKKKSLTGAGAAGTFERTFARFLSLA